MMRTMACQGSAGQRGSRCLSNHNRNIHHQSKYTMLKVVANSSRSLYQGKWGMRLTILTKSQEELGLVKIIVADPTGASVPTRTLNQTATAGVTKAHIVTDLEYLVATEVMDYITVHWNA